MTITPLSVPPQVTMNVTIRAATPADVPSILEIYNDAVLTTTASYDYEPTTLEARMGWYEAHVQSKLPVFVAIDGADDRVIGWSALSSFRQAHGYCFTAEDSIYIAADRRGQGIGKLLLHPLIESAQQLGLHSLMAGIDADNIPSLKLHASFGFEQVAYLKEIAFKFDRWLDLILMQRILK